MSLAVVVLPQPDSPTMASVSPWGIEKLMPSTAFTQPTTFVQSTPSVTGKCFFSPCGPEDQVVVTCGLQPPAVRADGPRRPVNGGGYSCRQRSSAYGHRAANRQPAGRSHSAGGCPVIE